MNLWLDDERRAPAGWYWVRTSKEAIDAVKNFGSKIEKMSLDHDLGGDDTGYKFLCWIEEQVECYGMEFNCDITVHSANPVGAIRMRQIINRIIICQE